MMTATHPGKRRRQPSETNSAFRAVSEDKQQDSDDESLLSEGEGAEERAISPNSETTIESQSQSSKTRIKSSSSHPNKYTQLVGEPQIETKSIVGLRCLLPPHAPLQFHTIEDYEVHYMKQHTNRCEECGKNFPLHHYLELHLTEQHDPLVAARREGGEKTYACFVEDCQKVCSSPYKRKLHAIAKHGFPDSYHFYVINDGIHNRGSMLNRTKKFRHPARRNSQSSSKQANVPQRGGDQLASKLNIGSMDRDRSAQDASIELITNAMSSLKFTPRQVTFGTKGRAGFAKKPSNPSSSQ